MPELNANLLALKREIETDPGGRGYATMTADQIVTDLTDPRYVTMIERMISERTLFAVLGAARATALMDA